MNVNHAFAVTVAIFAISAIAVGGHDIPTTGSILPFMCLPIDTTNMPMPTIDGISHTNRCDVYYLSNGIYRCATTPESFWLFVSEKTNLWYLSISNGIAEAAVRLSFYYSMSLSDEILAFRWMAAAVALGDYQAISNIEVMASYPSNKDAMSVAFSLSREELQSLEKIVQEHRDWRSAMRIALYYRSKDALDRKTIEWMERAARYGSSAAAIYSQLLKSQWAQEAANEPVPDME